MISKSDYFERLKLASVKVTEVLTSKGVSADKLCFGGEGKIPVKKPRIPIDPNSNFLGNRAMGDWAEEALKSTINSQQKIYQALHYGDTNELAAGDELFKEYYLSELESTRVYGKRPDLLLYGVGNLPAKDALADKPISATEEVAKLALAAIEVRSSKFRAIQYMRVREEEKVNGKKGVRLCPSFTVKVEDLIIVYRWMEKFHVRQSYMQVFLDSIFGINFLDIFELIGEGKNIIIEKPKQSQEKATIMIPITLGHQVASCATPPTFRMRIQETRLGRVDAFVAPEAGAFVLNGDNLNAVLFA